MTATKTFTSGAHAFTFKASAVPTLRTDRLLAYLSEVGYSDVWMTKNLAPVLKRWEEPVQVFKVLKAKGFEKADVKTLETLLRGLFDTKVSTWREQVNASDEEGTPERELADEADYWAAYVPTFGREVFRLRAIKWEGKILFMVDDVAKMYGGGYAEQPTTNFINRVISGICKIAKIKKLTYPEILASSPSSEKDKATMKKGKYFVDRKTMLRVLAKSSKPSAEAFVEHLIDVLDGKKETLAAFKERKVKMRSEEREKQLGTYPIWDKNNLKHGASVIRSNGEVFHHVTKGKYATQAEYVAKNKIGSPINDNLPDEIVSRTNLIREVSMVIADSKNVKGQYAYDDTIAEAATAADLLASNPSAVAALAARLGLTQRARRFNKAA